MTVALGHQKISGHWMQAYLDQVIVADTDDAAPELLLPWPTSAARLLLLPLVLKVLRLDGVLDIFGDLFLQFKV